MNSTLKKNRICAVIPFYNESSTISKISLETLEYVDKVILVNDGSTDDSLKNVPSHEQIILISTDKNEGKGAALRKGFQKSIELNFDFTLTLDADFQHEPKWIPLFIDKLEDFSIVVGNRLNDISGMPLQRILSNKITSSLLSIKTGVYIADSQCGFRAFRTNILKDILPNYSGFEAESEMLILAARNNLLIGSVNISTIYGDEKSKIKPVRTIYGFLKVLSI